MGKTLLAVDSTRAGLVLLRFAEPKHQSNTDPGSAPGRAALAAHHSLRLLQETILGKALAAVGSTPAGLFLLRFFKPGAHGLAVDLATGSPTGIKKHRIKFRIKVRVYETTLLSRHLQ